LDLDASWGKRPLLLHYSGGFNAADNPTSIKIVEGSLDETVLKKVGPGSLFGNQGIFFHHMVRVIGFLGPS
jgi:hypothetical protein